VVVGSPVTLASAQPSDALGIATVQVASWQAAYQNIFPHPDLASLSVAQRQQWWERTIHQHPASILVARASGRGSQHCGFISFGAYRRSIPREWQGERVGEVWALYVHPTFWSQSVGSALWRSARERLLQSGYQRIALWVLSENARAIRFYEHLGFVPVPQTQSQVNIANVVRKESLYVFNRSPRDAP
jgi:ribosomal protein S18 acetylase RimI-like enzyme